MAEAVILMGLQGSGKTTYYEKNLKETHALVSMDAQKTPARMAAALEEAIRAGRSFAVDNTNITRSARRPFIERAKAAGYRAVCCYFEVPVRTAIGRNNHRKDKNPIPVPAILRAAKQIEPPQAEEGFDEIRHMKAA